MSEASSPPGNPPGDSPNPDIVPIDPNAPHLQKQQSGYGKGKKNKRRERREIPRSPEAEKGVLSSMLQDPRECIGLAMEKLSAEQFYDEGRQILFQTLIELHDSGKPVDFISITTALRDRDKLNAVGGPAEITDIYNFVPDATHFEYYAEILREKFILREIIYASLEHSRIAYGDVDEDKGEDNFDTVVDLLDRVEREVLAIRERVEKAEGQKTMREHVFDAIHQIEELFQNRDKLTGVSTGYKDLDEMTNGLHGAEMIVIAARPSMGKTSLAMNIVENVAVKSGLPVAVFSLEMSSQQLVQRMLCSQAGINMQKLRSGFLSEQRDFPKLTKAASRLGESDVFIDDTPSLSIMAMRAKSRRLQKQLEGRGKKLSLIAIDYLQLLRSESKRAKDNRQQEVAEISSGVKALAKELDVPIIVLAQLNRAPETRGGSTRPRLSDLRESGSIEQDADVVGLLVRDEYYAENEEKKEEASGRATLIIAKQRNGPTGDVPLTFRKELMRFESRARDEHDEM